MADRNKEQTPGTEARQRPAAKGRGAGNPDPPCPPDAGRPGNLRQRTPPPPTGSRTTKGPGINDANHWAWTSIGPNLFSSAPPSKNRDPLESAPLFTKEWVFNNSSNTTIGTWVEPPDTGATPSPKTHGATTPDPWAFLLITFIAGGTATIALIGVFHFICLLFLTDHLNDTLSRQETAAALTNLSLWLGTKMGIALFNIRCVSAATNIRRS